MTPEEIIKTTVLDFPVEIMSSYKGEFSEEIDEFIKVVTESYVEWESFSTKIGEDEGLAHISMLIYGAINLHAMSMHLLISGYTVSAGNAERQVLESIAMACLASKRNLGYLHRYSIKKYSTNKAVDAVIKKYHILNLNRDALKVIKKSRDFLNNYSHPTLMTVAVNMSLNSPGELFFGASFDPEKIDKYRIEISARLSLAKTFVKFINGIKYNLKM